MSVCGCVCVCGTALSVQPSATAFFQGTLHSALITGTLEHFYGSKYSDLEVTRKTLVPIYSKYWRQRGERRKGGGRKAFKVMKFCYNLKEKTCGDKPVPK